MTTHASAPRPTPGDKLLSRREAAFSLGVCPRTVFSLERRGHLPSVRLSARCIRYRATDVARLVDQALVGQPATPAPAAVGAPAGGTP